MLFVIIYEIVIMCKCSLVILKDSFSGDCECDNSSCEKSFLNFAFDFALSVVMFYSILCISDLYGRIVVIDINFPAMMLLHS